MPKRTNDFQDLVAIIHRALAPKGAVVTESALVETGTAGETREIDVLIETKIVEYRMKIAVEAKDEHRPMDSTKFESIVGKYLVDGGVKVNKVVVVTHHGFYEPVIERAKKLGIELLTLTEAKEVDWSQFRPPGNSFKCNVDFRNFQVEPRGRFAEEELASVQVVCSCGRQHGNLVNYAHLRFGQEIASRYADFFNSMDAEVASTGIDKKAHVDIQAGEGDHKPHLVLGDESVALEKLAFDICFTLRQPTIPNAPIIAFSLAPHVCSIELVPPIEGAKSADVIQHGHIICACCGRDHGTLSEKIRAELDTEHAKTNLTSMLAEAIRTAADGHARITVTVPIIEPQRVRFNEVDHPTKAIKIQIHAVSGTAPLECKQFELRLPDGAVKLVSHMQTVVAGKALSILMPNGTQSEQICLRIEDAKSSKEEADSGKSISGNAQ